MLKKLMTKTNIILLACLIIFVAGGVYLYYNYVYLPDEIDRRNKSYEELYQPATEAPTDEPTIEPTIEPSIEPTPEIIEDTRIEGAIQSSFDGLLNVNPDTIGFLSVGSLLSLPVVQRADDNDYYLTHNFSGEKSDEGALFLDGVNRLELDDMCMIIYGHNMKNNTMFGRLPNYEIEGVLARNPITRFDTLYENRSYVPFAVFAISDNPKKRNYMNIRQLDFTQNEFEAYVEELRSRSLFDIPIDVEYGDALLVLVTCDYADDDGRFIVALREIREGEREDELSLLVGQARRK